MWMCASITAVLRSALTMSHNEGIFYYFSTRMWGWSLSQHALRQQAGEKC